MLDRHGVLLMKDLMNVLKINCVSVCAKCVSESQKNSESRWWISWEHERVTNNGTNIATCSVFMAGRCMNTRTHAHSGWDDEIGSTGRREKQGNTRWNVSGRQRWIGVKRSGILCQTVNTETESNPKESQSALSLTVGTPAPCWFHWTWWFSTDW